MGILYGGSIRFYHFLAATREMAFIQAISAAAITHEIMHQCKQNKIPGCDCPAMLGPSGDICRDYVSFARRKSRPFTDGLIKYRKRLDVQTAVILHNNAVGREVTHLIYRVCGFISIDLRLFLYSSHSYLRDCYRC